MLEDLGCIVFEAEFESFRIEDISANAEEILGYPVDEYAREAFLLGQLVHSDDVEHVLNRLIGIFDGGRDEFSFRAVTADGSTVELHALVARNLDNDAEAARFRGMLFEHTGAADARELSEERLQLALDAADMGVWDWNVLESKLYWSDQLYRLHGTTADEVGELLENYMELVERIHPEDLVAIQELVQRALTTGEDYNVEYRLRMPDGSYRWLYVKGRIYFDEERNPTRISGTAQDITARKAAELAARRELEERMRAKAELKKLAESLEQRVSERTSELETANDRLKQEVSERRRTEEELADANRRLVNSNRELQDFAYVASHDLKEPLRKITTFADLLKTDCTDEISDDGLLYIDRMQDSAARMMRLINDLLDFSRVKTSGEPFSTVDLNRIIDEVIADLEVRITEVGATIEQGELPSIDADATQMRQLFQNLISNALKFRQADKPPIVSIRSVDTEPGHANGLLRLIIEDNGIGFENKHANRVFSPFQRLHKNYDGTGMGLAICRRIVERHHGSISVSSTPGEGTKFKIELPVDQPEPSSKERSEDADRSVASGHDETVSE